MTVSLLLDISHIASYISVHIGIVIADLRNDRLVILSDIQ